MKKLLFGQINHAYEKLNYLLSAKPELSRNGGVWAKAAESFEKLDEDANKGGPAGLEPDYTVQEHKFLSNRPDTRIGTTWRMGLKVGINLVNLGKRY